MTPVTLATTSYDRIAHRRTDEEWLAAAWAESTTRVLPVAGTREAREPEERWPR